MTAEKEDQTYVYTGPAEYHSLIGQIMAALGYIGGHESKVAGAAIQLRRREDGRWLLSCTYGGKTEAWQSEAVLFRSGHERSDMKDCLLHWHHRFTGGPQSPWGTLIGVRPTKLAHHLMDRGMGAQEAGAVLRRSYGVAVPTARFIARMAALQRPYVTDCRKEAALYIGIPYCPSHCLYCSFPSRLIGAARPSFLEAFAAAVEADIEDIQQLCMDYGLHVRTIYVGGGTPTCLPLPALRRILKAADRAFSPVEEWTVEAGRPDTAADDMLCLLRECGADRISVNPQTMQQSVLDALGRCHRVEDVYRMYEACRAIGFRTVNMDFIAGLPGQTLRDMQENMEIVCQLHPENVTIHTLALKKKAPLFHHPLRQQIPPSETVGRMLAVCSQGLQKAGYIPYYMYRQKYMAASFANVGYALPGYIGRYNIEMMEERQTILAAGPGSATKFICADGHSLKKVYMPKDVDTYMQVLRERMKQRRHLCSIIYGGED
ncbi:coproporphyrinogen dehydrogenase HemZ [Megasphaera cerevisiae]|jgi:oxygen-independent coproporphyrinogen-3 oxidase|nr:coproporphyrinogen dehydrogenase HemZ [Megasphaera cerevisiae]